MHDNGAYFVFEDGKKLDLGHTVEFRSGLEVGHRLKNGWRVGVALFHLSYGGIGDRNPGTEALVFSISIPLSQGDSVAATD